MCNALSIIVNADIAILVDICHTETNRNLVIHILGIESLRNGVANTILAEQRNNMSLFLLCASLYIGSTGIRVSQALSMALALISFILLVVNARRQHKPEELYVNRVAASAAASESPAEETESNKEE